MKQNDIMQNITTRELTKAVYLSQAFFILISIILSFILFTDFKDWLRYFILDLREIAYYGLLLGSVFSIVEIILFQLLPKRYFDDGGINEKLFRNQSIIAIFFISLVVAISEELLFRGVLQTVFGYFFASSLFVVVHYRYLRKPVLLVLIIATSFLIGFLFEMTQNLFVTIAFHFIVDFILGVFIKMNR